MKNRHNLRLGVFILLGLPAGLAAQGAAITWTNLAGGNWSGAVNWSPNQAPGAGDTALITNTTASYAVTLDVAATVGGLVVGGAGGTKTQTFNLGGQELTLKGAATVTLTGVLDIGGGGMSLSAPLTNNGTVNWEGAGAILLDNDGTATNTGLIWNAGQWNITTSQTLYNEGTSADDFFHNRGTLTMNYPGGIMNMEPYLDNTGGSVVAQVGMINFTAGSNLGGSFQAAGGAAITFNGGTINWNGTANFSGNAQITGGTVNVTASVTSLAATGVTITGLSNIVSGAYLTNCVISDAERIVGAVYWVGGVLNDTGSLTVAGTGALNLYGDASNTNFIEGPLTNNGTVNWHAGGVQVVNDNNPAIASGGIWNLGQWNVQGGGLELTAAYGFGYEIFHNSGNLAANAAADNATFSTYLDNTGGSVVAQGGSFNFAAGSNLAGSFQASGGGVIDFTGGTLNWNGTANFSGNVQITGGTVNVTASVNSLAATGVTITGLSNIVSGAYLTNCAITDAERIAGTVYWSGGVLDDSGSLTVAGTGVLNLISGGSFDLLGVLTNNGTVNWQACSVQIFNDGSTIIGGVWNQGQWNIPGSQTLANYFGPAHEVFHNAGTVTLNSATGTFTFAVGFINDGKVDVELGTLVFGSADLLENSGTLEFGLNSLTSYGQINLPGAAALTGTLSAHLNDGYLPTASGNSFPVVTYGSKTGSFTITNLPAEAVWQPTYGTTALSLTLIKLVPQIVWPTPANIVYGTALSVTLHDATAVSPVVAGTNLVGAYIYAPATGTILDAGSNQMLSVVFTPGDLSHFTNVTGYAAITVTKAPLTVTPTNVAKTYGQTTAIGGGGFTVSGLVNGDSVTSVTFASAGTAPTAPVSGSPYPITGTNAVGDAGLTNYNITYGPGSLTVGPAALSITADNVNKVAGKALTFAGTEFTASGLQNNETIGMMTLTSSGTSPSAAAGTYNIVPSAPTGGTFSPGNYKDSFVDGTLTVLETTTLALARHGNQYVFTFPTVPNQTYQLLANTNLSNANDGNWVPVGAPISGTGGTESVTNSITAPTVFFQLAITP